MRDIDNSAYQPVMERLRQEQSRAPSAPEVAVITVEPQQVVLTTELPGRTTAYRVAEIRPQVNGLIQKTAVYGRRRCQGG